MKLKLFLKTIITSYKFKFSCILTFKYFIFQIYQFQFNFNEIFQKQRL